jgi:hypothetical protein
MGPEQPQAIAPAPTAAIEGPTPTGMATKAYFSKSAAQRYLRRFFLGAGFQTRSKPEDIAAGNERWGLWCVGPRGQRVQVVEVAGPASHLPSALVIAGLRRLDIKATLSNTGISLSRDLPNEVPKDGERALHEGQASDP